MTFSLLLAELVRAFCWVPHIRSEYNNINTNGQETLKFLRNFINLNREARCADHCDRKNEQGQCVLSRMHIRGERLSSTAKYSSGLVGWATVLVWGTTTKGDCRDAGDYEKEYKEKSDTHTIARKEHLD